MRDALLERCMVPLARSIHLGAALVVGRSLRWPVERVSQVDEPAIRLVLLRPLPFSIALRGGVGAIRQHFVVPLSGRVTLALLVVLVGLLDSEGSARRLLRKLLNLALVRGARAAVLGALRQRAALLRVVSVSVSHWAAIRDEVGPRDRLRRGQVMVLLRHACRLLREDLLVGPVHVGLPRRLPERA